MRQPLQILVDAIPDAALRPLVLELLQNGATPTAPVASAPNKPDVAETTTPAPPAKHAGGHPRGSPNKAKAPTVETGAAKAAKLAALPDREQLVRAVANGEMTQVAAARQLGCTAKTVSTWVTKFRSEQSKPAASPEQHGQGTSGNGNGSAAQPAPAAPGRSAGPVAETEAQRKARLARHAARQRERDAERRRLRDAERAAQAAQLDLPVGGNGNGVDAARTSISAVRPVPAKPDVDPAAEAALAARLWQHAAELNPTAPWRPVAAEFGLNAALALNHYRSETMPPIAAAAATRFCSIAHN
jgi:transposase-like protein